MSIAVPQKKTNEFYYWQLSEKLLNELLLFTYIERKKVYGCGLPAYFS
jgi:hypothetical protein